MNKGVSAGLICPAHANRSVFFVQEIDVVQEFMNMQESLNKD
jgi:hypothetical protein